MAMNPLWRRKYVVWRACYRVQFIKGLLEPLGSRLQVFKCTHSLHVFPSPHQVPKIPHPSHIVVPIHGDPPIWVFLILRRCMQAKHNNVLVWWNTYQHKCLYLCSASWELCKTSMWLHPGLKETAVYSLATPEVDKDYVARWSACSVWAGSRYKVFRFQPTGINGYHNYQFH